MGFSFQPTKQNNQVERIYTFTDKYQEKDDPTRKIATDVVDLN